MSRYRYRYIGSDIVNIGIGIIGIGIGICYNYIIGYDIGIGIKSWFNRYNEISVSVSLFYRYIGISSIIGIGIGLVSNSRKISVSVSVIKYRLYDIGLALAGIPGLAIDQEPDAIRDRLCIHSSVASTTLGNWRNIWNVSLSVSQDQVFNVCFNKNITCEVFIPHESKEECFLAAVYYNRKISLLFCVTQRQEVPLCNQCVRRKCNHYTILTNF